MTYASCFQDICTINFCKENQSDKHLHKQLQLVAEVELNTHAAAVLIHTLMIVNGRNTKTNMVNIKLISFILVSVSAI